MKFEIKKTHYEIVSAYIKNPKNEAISKSAKDAIEAYPEGATYEEFYKQCYSVINAMPDPKMASYLANVMYHMYMMHIHEERMFYITPNLTSKLMGTTLNFKPEVLNSPFPELFMQTDSGFFQFYSQDGNLSSVDGFYVSLVEETDGRTLRIMAASMEDYDGDWFEDNCFYFRIRLQEGVPIQDQVDKHMKEAEQEGINGDMYGGYSNTKFIKGMCQFVVNSLMYMTSSSVTFKTQKPEDVDLIVGRKKSVKKARKAAKRLGRQTAMDFIVIGSDIRDDSMVKDAKESGIKTGHWELNHLVYVRGHWRFQRHGEGNALTKTIFIQPYKKGKELADVIHKPYLVK